MSYPPPQPRFGEWVRTRRMALGLTQQGLGALASCSGHAIRKIEADERRPSEGLAERLAAHLQLDSAERSAFLQAARGRGAGGPQNAGAERRAHRPDGASRHAIPRSLPLVGRELQLTQIRQWLSALRSRHGRVALVEGEPGAGKSRLLAEALELANRLELPAIATKCFEIEIGIPYYALVRLLEDAAGQAGSALLQGLQPLSRAEIAAIAPTLAHRLEPLPELSAAFPEARRVRLFAAIEELCDALAGSRGLVVAVDDYQWIDGASMQALHSMARHTAAAPRLLLIGSRTEDFSTDGDAAHGRASLKELEHTELLSLGRLDPRQVRELLERMLDEPVEQALVDRLYAESEGNPFFLREMLPLVLNGTASATSGAGPTRLLPASLQTAVQRRLQGLGPGARSLLDAASVLGRRFRFELLAAISLLAQGAALNTLDELIRFGWLVEDDDGVHYDFPHDKLREAVYQDMSAARRTSIHRRVAEHLALDPEMADGRQAAVIAEHAEAAGLWSLAVDQRTRAGEQAERVLGLREAESHYTSAIAHCLAHAGFVPAPARVDLLERRGAVRALMSDVDAAAADLRAAISETEPAGLVSRRVRLLTILGMTFQRADRYAEGVTALQKALALARASHDHSAAALASYWLGDIAWTLERNDEARQHFDEVMRASRAYDLDDGLLAKAYHGVAEVASLDARPVVAFRDFEVSLRLARALGDRFQQCENLSVMGWMHLGPHGDADYASAFAEFDRCLEIATQADMPWFVIPCELGRAVGLAALGRFREALAGFDGVLAMVQEAGIPRWEAAAQTWLAWCRVEMERYAEALEHVRRARACIDAAGVSFFSHLLPGIETTALSRLGRAYEASDPADDVENARRALLGYAVLSGLLARMEWLHARGQTSDFPSTLADLEHVGSDRQLPEAVALAKYWRAQAACAAGDRSAAVAIARETLIGLRHESRFSIRLALLRLVFAAGHTTEQEARTLREMESRLTD
ncbi:AAA family ATPase [Piscinibacter sp. XHJ-5]|uniref:ATP-binding protein n=1 Tax=Piscinibacter sp. XHJ-5 TaxID=3037797 RepID=UPI00245308FD|nr:AAA family ATPase [Piscinibacter sp. XHJ-5]